MHVYLEKGNEMKNDFYFLLGSTLLFCIICIVLVVGFVSIVEYEKCDNAMQLDTDNLYHYDFFLGCRIQLETGVFIPLDDYVYIYLDNVWRETK